MTTKNGAYEAWLPVIGYEGLYEVSDLGRVRSLDRCNSRGVPIKGRLSRAKPNWIGYVEVGLYRDGRKETCRVHMLVMAAFIGPCPTGMLVRHLNDVPYDNRLVNLAYGTLSDNGLDRTRNTSGERQCEKCDRAYDTARRGSSKRFCQECAEQNREEQRHADEKHHSSNPLWRAIPGFEGLYEVSDDGRIKSLERITPHGHRHKERMLNLFATKTNHRVVILWKNNKQFSREIHSLVLEAFVGPRPEGMVACHFDGDPTNNRLDNLRWDTQAENMSDVTRHGRGHTAKTCCSKCDGPYRIRMRNGKPRRYCSACKEEQRKQRLADMTEEQRAQRREQGKLKQREYRANQKLLSLAA